MFSNTNEQAWDTIIGERLNIYIKNHKKHLNESGNIMLY